MSKKSNVITKSSIVSICSFVALILAGIIWVIVWIPALGGVAAVLNFLKDILLLVAVALAAHNYAKKLGTAWYVIYWIIVVIAIIGILFGSGWIPLS
ncbi:MAG: hypothetical protein LBU04_05605 [Christensenellaceae bacterium]|jgi:hypothetical protein|nr:hypothetical protein [Christensenellaceae bacterium]